MSSRGVLSRISRAEYDAQTERVNYSGLKHFARSPAHYRFAMDHRDQLPDTDAMVLGRVAHLMVFEPHLLDLEIAIWGGGRRAGKEWTDFQAAHEGKEIVREQDLGGLREMTRAVREHPDVVPHLAEGRAELTAIWQDPATGIECRGRMDWVSKSGVIVDLKTTRDAEPDAFARQAHQMFYHAQAAFYSDAVEVITGVRLPFMIVAVENTAPYPVQVYELSGEAIDAGRAAYRSWLRKYKRCAERGEWPGYSAGPLPLYLPRWADKSGESFELPEDREVAS